MSLKAVHILEEISLEFALYNGLKPAYLVIATDIWDLYQNNEIQISSHQFECPQCHVPLLLVNLNSKTPKRIYFKTFPEQPHLQCEAKNQTFQQFKRNHPRFVEEDGLITKEKLPDLLFKQQTRNGINSINISSNSLNTEVRATNQNKQIMTANEYHARRATSFSLHRLWLEIYKRIDSNEDLENIKISIDWPHLDNNDKEVSYVKPLKFKEISLSKIVFQPNIQKLKQKDLKKDFIFWGEVTVEKKETKYGQEFFLNFINSEIRAHWTSNTLKGLLNINKIRQVANTQKRVEIMLCGYVYFDKKISEYIFIKRTKYLSDFITIAD